MHRSDHINQLIYLILNTLIPLTSYLSYSGLDELAIARSERPLPTKSRSVCTWLTARARSSRRLAGDPPGRRKKRIASTTEAKPTSAPSDPIYATIQVSVNKKLPEMEKQEQLKYGWNRTGKKQNAKEEERNYLRNTVQLQGYGVWKGMQMGPQHLLLMLSDQHFSQQLPQPQNLHLCLLPLHLKVPAQYSTNRHIFHYRTPFTCKYTLTNPHGDFVLRLTGMMILQPAT